MLDVGFELQGTRLPREHRRALAQAVAQALPWWAQEPAAGIHPLKLSADGQHALLSRRSRLTLRLPQQRLAQALALSGQVLLIDGQRLGIGAAHAHELLPWGTLYAHVVHSEQDSEAGFMAQAQAQLQALPVHGRSICGRRQRLEGGAVCGYSLMVDGLSRGDALRLLQQGLGGQRALGCGLFVPHKSAAAVGAPPWDD